MGGRHVGRLAVVGVRAATALFPRLTFDFGVLLQESPGDSFEEGRPIQQFQLADLEGELFLANGQLVGSLRWCGPRSHARATTYPAETRIALVCDLDAMRVARVEEARAGADATFRAAFWLSLQDTKGDIAATLDAIHITIPREEWLKVIGGFLNTRYELVEIPYPALVEPEFEATVSHLRDGIAKINRGEYDDAVAACRRAIESLVATLDVGHKGLELQAALTPHSDSKRAEAYAGIISRIKALGNMTIHRRHALGKFTRAEAQFVVGTTAHSLALVARLLRRELV